MSTSCEDTPTWWQVCCWDPPTTFRYTLNCSTAALTTLQYAVDCFNSESVLYLCRYLTHKHSSSLDYWGGPTEYRLQVKDFVLQVYSCSTDGTVRLWDFTDGILIKVKLDPQLCFLNDSKFYKLFSFRLTSSDTRFTRFTPLPTMTGSSSLLLWCKATKYLVGVSLLWASLAVYLWPFVPALIQIDLVGKS